MAQVTLTFGYEDGHFVVTADNPGMSRFYRAIVDIEDHRAEAALIMEVFRRAMQEHDYYYPDPDDED